MTKDKNVLSKLQKSVRNFRNLRQCPRNTQVLTTVNVRLFKTVLNLKLKNIHDRQKRASLENRTKLVNHSTLLTRMAIGGNA